VKEFTSEDRRVLFAGWWLASRPWHAQSWGQRELLDRLYADLGRDAVRVAWPRGADASRVTEWRMVPTWGGAHPLGRLLFEQVGLPLAARRERPCTLLVPYASGPLVSAAPTAVLAESDQAKPRSVWDRLQTSFGRAGLAGAWRQLSWRDNLPQAADASSVASVPPAVPPSFVPESAPEDVDIRRRAGLPGDYVLALGATAADLPLLLAAWSWMTPSLGGAFRLVAGPLGPRAPLADELAEGLGLEGTFQTFESIPWTALPAVLRGASCLLFGTQPATWQVLRWALAAAVPAAGVRSSSAEAILGPSGYLVDPADTRSLGAAGLSLLVDEEGLAGRLKRAGLSRAAAYHRAWGDGSLGEVLDGAP
jgi:hypothetical protein